MKLDRNSLLTPDYVTCELLKVPVKTLALPRSSVEGAPLTTLIKRVPYPPDLLQQWSRRAKSSRAVDRPSGSVSQVWVYPT